MAYVFNKTVDRKRVRNGEDWRTLMTVKVIMTDDTNPDFPPTTRKVSGYREDNGYQSVMAVSLAGELNHAIDVYEAKQADILAETEALGDPILDKIDNYLAANVGI